MHINEKTVQVYLDNIDDRGKRISTWVVLAKMYNVSKITLAKISSIRKRTTDEQFNLFIECMHSGETVLLSNGVSSYNIEFISRLLRQGETIVGKGKASSATVLHTDRSSLYLLESAGYYKIGVTLDSSIAHRISQLQTGNPYAITLVSKTGTIRNAYELEAQLRSKYKEDKFRGEWFSFSEEQVADVVDIINQAKEL